MGMGGYVRSFVLRFLVGWIDFFPWGMGFMRACGKGSISWDGNLRFEIGNW